MKANKLIQSIPTTIRRRPVIWSYVKDLVRYQDGYQLQNELVRHKINNPSAPDYLILLQHHPVYTTGRRQLSDQQLELERDRLAIINPKADFFPTSRGRQITYHGPGQLVAYPILNLSMIDLNTRMYVEFLVNLLRSILIHPSLPKPIESLDPAKNPDLPVGIFIGTQWCKIASIGVQVRRRITNHGIALNVEDQSESGFKSIVACGLKDTQLTSIQSVLAQELKVEDLVKPTIDLFNELLHPRVIMEEFDSNNQDYHEDPIGFQILHKFLHSHSSLPSSH
ncbi:hypothetical protein KEM48_014382 [Puccinia striiformis f. sp. tritici PST-130]|nr:hypothetical protein KEM48_014382 [Puccinia striiformis f. sp. tritici PST-130]